MGEILYIGALGRSGSTVLERLVATFPGHVAVGEVVHLWERGLRDDDLCGCGARFSACPFWQEVGERAYGGFGRLSVDGTIALKHAVDRNRFMPYLLAGERAPVAYRDALARYGELLAPLYQAILGVSGARTVVDSSKHPSYAMVLWRVGGQDLRLVHLVRDARGVANSTRKVVVRPETAERREEMERLGTATVGGRWLSHNTAFHLLARRGVPTAFVRYEDFARYPDLALQQIAWLTGDHDLDVSAHLARLGADGAAAPVVHSVAGNPIRLASGPVQVRLDEAWRHDLPRAERAKLAALTWPLRAAYRVHRPAPGPGMAFYGDDPSEDGR